jgi:hypothetical protein
MWREAELERNVAGWYDLVGVSGSSLPARALGVHLLTERVDLCRILSGTMWLIQGGTYVLEVSSEHDGAPGITYTQIIKDCGTWRYIPSGVDATSGAILLTGFNGEEISASVSGMSLVQQAPLRMRTMRWTMPNWVFLRQGRTTTRSL